MERNTRKTEVMRMKFIDLVDKQLIGTNNAAISEYSADELAKAYEKRDLYGYNFERVWENGTLDSIFDNDEWQHNDFRLFHMNVTEVGEQYRGYYVNKGADYLFAAKILYDVAMSFVDTDYVPTDIRFQCGVSLKKWQSGARPEHLNLASSYDLQVQLTHDYFLRKLVSQNNGDICKKIVERMKNIYLSISLTSQDAVE